MTNHNFINFRIDKNNYFQIRFSREYTFEELYFTDYAKVLLFSKNDSPKIVFNNDTIFSVLQEFECTLHALLERKLPIETFLPLPKGVCYAQSIIEHKIEVIKSPEDKYQLYKMSGFKMWSTNYRYPVIMYNKADEIYMEIAPIYFKTTEKNDIQKYEKFMSDFKPLVIRTIKRCTILKWYKKVHTLFEQHKAFNFKVMQELDAKKEVPNE